MNNKPLARLRALEETVRDGLLDVDEGGLLTHANPSALRLFGYSQQEVQALGLWDLVPELSRLKQEGPRVSEPGGAAHILEDTSRELLCRRKDGSVFNARATLLSLEGGGYLCVVSDVTDQKHLVETEELHALFDPLTRLPGRGLFSDRLMHAFERARADRDYAFTVLYLDIDRFKRVNESLGHEAGDSLLVAFSLRLQAAVRPFDTISRLGGDEFGVLLDNVRDDHTASAIAERILRELADPFPLGEGEVVVSASIGVVHNVSRYGRHQEILRDADSAMYRAKSCGGASYALFAEEMHTSSVRMMGVESDLRRALSSGDFEVHYQPIVSMAGLHIIGLEALIRLRRPGGGLVMPDDFISIAEDTGIINPMGQWLIDCVCSQIGQWRAEGHKGLFVSLNCSAIQLRRGGLLDTMARHLRCVGLDPASLVLELTERVAADRAVWATLAEIREMGIRVCIDDFGTGYSSLSELRHLPADILKIDRSFVRDIPHSKAVGQIIRAVLRMAKGLGMMQIAEGVEKDEQLDFLGSLGCDAVQGYLLARPMPAKALAPLLCSRVAPSAPTAPTARLG